VRDQRQEQKLHRRTMFFHNRFERVVLPGVNLPAEGIIPGADLGRRPYPSAGSVTLFCSGRVQHARSGEWPIDSADAR
jgi:hypothetical protein